MRYLKKITFISLILITGFVIVANSNSSVAQEGLQVQGLGIDPFLIELNMSPGQTKTQEITLSNVTDKPLTFTASINDFTPNGNTGQPIFLNSDEESDPKFSLSKWIVITQQPLFTIPARTQTKVAFNISVPNDAEPGTHYGGILFGQPLQSLDASGAKVQHKAGAIILVKLGKSQEKVEVNNFFTQQEFYQKGPIEFITSLHNYGNVHSKAKGDIKIHNIWGVQVTEVPVNPDAQIILPESARDFSSTWQPKLGFGRYTAEAVLYYGNPKIELRSQTVFWILPTKEIVLGMIILLILGIIIQRSIRQYNQYIIKHSHDRDEN